MTLGSVGLAGLWAGFSDQLSARAVRELIAETGRKIIGAKETPSPAEWDNDTITAAWLGHSTVLMNFLGMTILTDPVLYKRVGASTFMGTIGAKRLIAPAMLPKDLPPIDLVVLSHAHMDHFDYPTLRALPGNPKVVTAKATVDLFRTLPFQTPHELGWGDETMVSTAKGDVHVKAFEVRHWGARVRYDTHRGYNGYVLEREGRRILFGGDTAWTPDFADLRGRKTHDLAIMPIGAYKPYLESHCNPEQAVQMAEAAGSEFFLPIHFKTFPLGREGGIEPMERLELAMDPDRIGWREVGETFVLPA